MVVCLIVLIITILLLVLWYRNRLHSYRTYEEKRKDGEVYENGDTGDMFNEAAITEPKSVVSPHQTTELVKNSRLAQGLVDV